jgi:hypothetical protein
MMVHHISFPAISSPPELKKTEKLISLIKFQFLGIWRALFFLAISSFENLQKDRKTEERKVISWPCLSIITYKQIGKPKGKLLLGHLFP